MWDYLKEIGQNRLSSGKVMRLAQIFGFLAVHGDMPLHFLKVLDLDENSIEDGSTGKAQGVWLYLFFEKVFDECKDEQQAKTVFTKGLLIDKDQENENLHRFVKAVSA